MIMSVKFSYFVDKGFCITSIIMCVGLFGYFFITGLVSVFLCFICLIVEKCTVIIMFMKKTNMRFGDQNNLKLYIFLFI